MKLPELSMAKKTQSHPPQADGFDHGEIPSLAILLLAGRTPALPDSSSDNDPKIQKYIRKRLHEP